MLLPNHERAVIERRGLGGYSYKLVGPGRYLMKFRERLLVRFHTNPRSRQIDADMRTEEDTPVKITGTVLYQVNPKLLTSENLAKVENWNNGVWDQIVQWRTQAVLWRIFSRYTWREIGRCPVQEAIEKQATQMLAKRLSDIGLDILGFTLIKTELPPALQESIIRYEQDILDARRRAMEYKQYADVLGKDMNEALIMKFLDEAGGRDNNWLSLMMLLNSNLISNGQPGQNSTPPEQLSALFQNNGSTNGKHTSNVKNEHSLDD